MKKEEKQNNTNNNEINSNNNSEEDFQKHPEDRFLALYSDYNEFKDYKSKKRSRYHNKKS